MTIRSVVALGALRGRILGVMTTRSNAPRRHLASSPFAPRVEPVVPDFAVDDRVSHQTYGLGRVTGKDNESVTVDFGNRTMRIVTPFPKLERL